MTYLFPQDVSATASPTFANITVNGAGTYAGGNFTSAPTFAGGTFTARVAMGTTSFSPISTLHVRGTAGISTTGNSRFFNVGSITNFNTPITGNDTYSPTACFEGSIVIAGSVGSVGAITGSDKRIKNTQGLTDLQECLRLIKQFEVTNYTYIDETPEYNGLQRKFIAQQIKEVFPEAVKIKTQVIPDIMKFANAATIVSSKVLQQNYFELILTEEVIKQQSKLRIIVKLDDDEEIDFIGYVILSENNKVTISVPEIELKKLEQSTTFNVFVYGHEVNDFLYIDYDAIFCLNVGATQELINENEKITVRLEKIENILRNLI